MGMYVQSNGTATPIPGGIPTDTLERIENDIAELRALRATFEKYGMAMITDSSAVTEKDTGLALWAGENNAGIEGTLANRVERIKENYSKKDADERIPSGKDLNSVEKAGFYYGLTTEVENSPESERTNFVIRVEGKVGDAIKIQTFYAQNGNSYRRTRTNYAAWTAWKSI